MPRPIPAIRCRPAPSTTAAQAAIRAVVSTPSRYLAEGTP
jgi:hypothetical protein